MQDLALELVADDDLPRLRQMADAYWDELMPSADTVRTPQSRSRYFTGRFGDGASQTFLALTDEQTIGFVRTVVDGKRATITDFYVDRDHRRKGAGSGMLRDALARFDKLGVEEVTLTVRRDNPGALAFWDANGFMVGHYELKQFRDPETGRAFLGALSSDFDNQSTSHRTSPTPIDPANRIEVRPSPIHGVGVFVNESIRCGEVLHRIDDSRVVDDEHPLRPESGEDPVHCDWLPDGTTVLMQEPARCLNHSCSPNVYVYSVNRIRYILAMRDIEESEELLFDYSIGFIDGDVLHCRCGAANCRGQHESDFFCLPADRQLQYLPFLDPWFVEVHLDRIHQMLHHRIAGEGRDGADSAR